MKICNKCNGAIPETVVGDYELKQNDCKYHGENNKFLVFTCDEIDEEIESVAFQSKTYLCFNYGFVDCMRCPHAHADEGIIGLSFAGVGRTQKNEGGGLEVTIDETIYVCYEAPNEGEEKCKSTKKES